MTEVLHSAERLIERFVLLGEVDADIVIDWLMEEAGARHSADTDFLAELFGKLQVCRAMRVSHILPYIDHDIVGALWHVVLKTEASSPSHISWRLWVYLANSSS